MTREELEYQIRLLVFMHTSSTEGEEECFNGIMELIDEYMGKEILPGYYLGRERFDEMRIQRRKEEEENATRSLRTDKQALGR